MSNHKNPKKIFISYSRHDISFARRLVMDLQEYGASVWVDFLEISPGDSFLEKIDKGIQESTNVIAVVSKHSAKSNWVKHELSSAKMRAIVYDQRFLIPVLISQCEMPSSLQRWMYADFRISYKKGFVELIRALDIPLSHDPIVSTFDLPIDLSDLTTQTLRLIAGRFRRRVNAIHLGFLQFESHGSALICVGAAIDLLSREFRQFLLTGKIGGVIQSGVTCIEKNIGEIENYRHSDPRTKSLLIVPIRFYDSVIGVIHLSSENVGEFLEDDVGYLETIAEHVKYYLELMNAGDILRNGDLPYVRMIIPLSTATNTK